MEIRTEDRLLVVQYERRELQRSSLGGGKGSPEKKNRDECGPVKSQGVVVVLVPYYHSECFSWPLWT